MLVRMRFQMAQGVLFELTLQWNCEPTHLRAHVFAKLVM